MFGSIHSLYILNVTSSPVSVVKTINVSRHYQSPLNDKKLSLVEYKCSTIDLFLSELCHFLVISPGGSEGKASVYNAGDPGSIPGSGSSSGEGNGNPLQYSCLENPMDRGAW